MSTTEKLQGEADRLRDAFGRNVDTDKLKAKLDVSNFEPNAILRGMQLTLVGGESRTARVVPACTTNQCSTTYSPESLAEPGHLHQRSLSTGRRCRGRRARH